MTDLERMAAIKAEHPWFDPARHNLGDAGIMETATGVLLDAEGEPASPAVRVQRQMAADAAKAAGKAGTKLNKPTTPPGADQE